MAKLLICRGPSPSGKTTFIRTWIAESPKTRTESYDKESALHALRAGWDVALEAQGPGGIDYRPEDFPGFTVTVREFKTDVREMFRKGKGIL